MSAARHASARAPARSTEPATIRRQLKPEVEFTPAAPRFAVSLAGLPAKPPPRRRSGPRQGDPSRPSARVQPLQVGPSDDVFEREADAVASRALGETARGDLWPLDASPPVAEPALRAKGAAGVELEASSATLTSGGRPLPAPSRAFFEARMGRGFDEVRLHEGPLAHELNRSIASRAFTYGHHVWLGRDELPGETFTMAHELVHVMQQTGPGPVAHAATGSMAAWRVQRTAAEPPSIGGFFAEAVGEATFGKRVWPFLKAVFQGFLGGLEADVASGRADTAKAHLARLLNPVNAAKFYGGYLLGFAIGLVSPITDLIHGIIGAVKLSVSALEWLAKWSPVGVALSAERQQKIANIIQRFGELSAEFGTAIAEFARDPTEAVKKLAGFLDQLMGLALGQAREFGTKAAHRLFDTLHEEFFAMGRSIGTIIGTLVAQILLLVLSDAIGNLVSKGAALLGKAAEFTAGKAVQIFEWVRSFAGQTVAILRRAARGALKLFSGVTEKAIAAFEALADLFTESTAALRLGEEPLAAGAGRGVQPPRANVFESRMLGQRATKTTVADLRTPKDHPSNVGKPSPARSAPTKPAVEEPLSAIEREMTHEQLEQKYILEEYAARQRAERPLAKQEANEAARTQERNKRGAGMAARPRHHVLPQEMRREFEKRGFVGDYDIDNYTVVLDESHHQAVHGGGDYKLGRTTGFEWNLKVQIKLAQEESALGRMMTRDEVMKMIRRLMKEYKIPARFGPFRG